MMDIYDRSSRGRCSAILSSESELSRLWRKAIALEAAVQTYFESPVLENGPFIDIEDRAFNARQELFDYLLSEHGLTKREFEALAGSL